MFVKDNAGRWVNLGTCRSVDIPSNLRTGSYCFILRSAIVLPDPASPNVSLVGNFETKEEAEKCLGLMWQAYRDGEKTWEL